MSPLRAPTSQMERLVGSVAACSICLGVCAESAAYEKVD